MRSLFTRPELHGRTFRHRSFLFEKRSEQYACQKTATLSPCSSGLERERRRLSGRCPGRPFTPPGILTGGRGTRHASALFFYSSAPVLGVRNLLSPKRAGSY